MIAHLPTSRVLTTNAWLFAVLVAGGIYGLAYAPWLSAIAAWFLLNWRGEEHLGPIVAWCGVAMTWWFAHLIPPPVIVWTLVTWAYVEAALVCWRKIRGSTRPHGLFGPVPTGIVLAMAIPFVPYPLALAFALVLVHSYVAFVGVAVAASVMLASPWPLVVLALCAGAYTYEPVRIWLDRWTPRGSSPDWRVRFVVADLAIRHATWRGHGPGTMGFAILGWGARLRRSLTFGEACCEPVQLVFEYGVLGGLAMFIFLGGIVGRLHLGSPWSASFLVGVTASLAYFPLRIAPIGVAFLMVAAHV